MIATIYPHLVSLRRLPMELLLFILRFLAASSTADCLTLCLVSSWTRRLALPYLVRTVTLTESVDFVSYGQDHVHERFLRFISRELVRTPYPDHAKLVRNLWIPYDRGTNLVEIWRRCTNVTKLTCSDIALSVLAALTADAERAKKKQKHSRWNRRLFSCPCFSSSVSDSSSEDNMDEPDRKLHLTVVSTHDLPSDLFLRLPPTVRPPIFQMTTHLRLYLALSLSFVLRRLAHAPFPKLTHLALHVTMWTDDLPDALERFLRSRRVGAALEALVLEFDFDALSGASWTAFVRWLRAVRSAGVRPAPDAENRDLEREESGGKKKQKTTTSQGVPGDRRVLFVSVPPCSLLDEWREEADGGVSLWERAEEETEAWEREMGMQAGVVSPCGGMIADTEEEWPMSLELETSDGWFQAESMEDVTLSAPAGPLSTKPSILRSHSS